MNHTEHSPEDTSTTGRRRKIRQALAAHREGLRQAMFGPQRDLGMETLEKMILSAVIIGAAVTFVGVFGNKFTELMAAFQGAF
ncbi:hypothetical protein ACIQ9K_35040 [Streptomyces microflavus]|uniref:hypothetical protein n=1 Tax=Streptomyces microflavus TaxID=1919 RepID=UPI00380B84A2